MFHKIFILSLGIFALTGCDAQKKMKNDPKKPDAMSDTKATKPNDQKEGIIYFTEGENKFLKAYGMNVTFKGISEDSRCPEGVNCIWAGVAVAQIQVMGTATRPMTLELASMDHPSRNYHQSTDFNGYMISLQEVTPYPKSEGGTAALAGKYKIGISIKKAEEPSDTTRK
ncbi:hypothetical protein FE904_11415 [Chryseobacterium indologenes]|uniref:hypothetical protein n=1 Tax=Chryseobacterium TaxID=59732 RepID=UPI0004884C9D|nr:MULTISPECIES: hypothetical protein [Chryseobacterium]ASE62217.1 hypothetical protein CEQ15_12280 [Chryseobacterium indologenes]TLX25558.1 hypothetical protein FE904_11415 [Chryseobacterium indologenes]